MKKEEQVCGNCRHFDLSASGGFCKITDITCVNGTYANWCLCNADYWERIEQPVKPENISPEAKDNLLKIKLFDDIIAYRDKDKRVDCYSGCLFVKHCYRQYERCVADIVYKELEIWRKTGERSEQ